MAKNWLRMRFKTSEIHQRRDGEHCLNDFSVHKSNVFLEFTFAVENFEKFVRNDDASLVT